MDRILTARDRLWRAAREPGAPVALLALVLIVAGCALRLHAFRFPSTLLFDEVHFVENARNYLAGRADWNDHPPLGKLLIAASIRVAGDGPLGWRLPALVLGLLTILCGALAAGRLFRDPRAGWLTAALLSADGFFIGYSRVGLLDGYLAACAAAALLVASARGTRRIALAGGALLGIAGNVKFSGAGVLLPLAVALLTAEGSGRPHARRQRLLSFAILVAVAGAVYCALFAIGLRMARQPASLGAVVEASVALLKRHVGLTEMKNPWVSGWPTWALPWRPVMLGSVDQVAGVRVLSSLGNLAVWWGAVATGLALSVKIAWRGLGATLGPGAAGPGAAVSERGPAGDGDFLAAHGRAALIVLALVAGFLAPWVLTHRDSYIYHFLPSYLGLVVLLGAASAWWIRRRPVAVLVFFVVVLLVTAFYAPVWSFVPLSPEAMRHRLFLPSWR
ncbi:MAG TPA: glycosyltransferase family 39 protein [Polyangia bacterium]|nr:glycosyltransferase family 39 protein [Polyangia bacterium]